MEEIRDQEKRRDNLFELLEQGGRNTPDLADVTKRLRERTERLTDLQNDLIALESAPTPGKAPDIDPDLAVEVMRDVIQNCDAQKKRAFAGAFIERITLAPEGVTVEYHPEALLNAGLGPRVRCLDLWLLDLGSNQGPTD